MPYTFCPKCGYRVEWAAYCSKCGAELTPGGSQPVAPEPVVSPIPSPPLGRSRLAIAAIVLGILGFLISPLGIGAIICGIMGLKQTRFGKMKGHGIAITGIVMGCVVLMIWVAAIFIMLASG